MSTYIYDQDGYVDEIGNSATLEALSKALSDKHKGFHELFTKGSTELIEELILTIEKLDLSQFDKPTKKSIIWLEDILIRTIGIALLTDGCGFMPPGMTEDDYT